VIYEDRKRCDVKIKCPKDAREIPIT